MLKIPILILIYFANGFAAMPCNFDVRMAQALHSQGFHRKITYHVRFANKYGDSHLYEQCYFGLEQTLPAGVFSNPDELEDLQRLNKLTAIPYNSINVEQFVEQSQPTTYFIMGQINKAEVNLWLPVHARYHKAAGKGGFFRNIIKPPRIFIRCPHLQLNECEPKEPMVKFLCNGTGNERCLWKSIPYSLSSGPEITIPVPVGNLDHFKLVLPVTVVTIFFCTAYLLITLHGYKMATLKKYRPGDMVTEST